MEIRSKGLLYQLALIGVEGSGRIQTEASRPLQVYDRKEKPSLDQTLDWMTSKVPSSSRLSCDSEGNMQDYHKPCSEAP